MGLPTTLPAALLRHVHCVVGPGACEGLNTQNQVRCLMAKTGHHLEDMIIGFDLPCSVSEYPNQVFLYTYNDDYKLDRKFEGVASNVCSTTWDFRPLPHWDGYFQYWRILQRSRERRAFHGVDWPPPRGHDGQLSSTWCCWKGAQSFNTQWAFRQLWKKHGEQCVHHCRQS